MLNRLAAYAAVALGAFAMTAAAFLAREGFPTALAWLPAGVAGATLLRLGPSQGLPFALGAVLAGVLFHRSWSIAIGLSLVATAGPALLARYLTHRRFEPSFRRWQDVLQFVFATAAFSVMSATLATLLPGLASAIGSNGPVFDAWLQWWLMACLGTLLVVPLLAGGSWQVLMQLVARRTELGLVLLATVLVTLASLGAPTPRNGFIVGPLALILVGYATLRLHFSVALAVAGVLTCVIGISAQAAPVSEFVSELFGLARASAFGLVNVLLIFTVQVLRSERTAALDALRAAERQHHEALVRAVRLEQVRIGERMHDEVGQEATALSLLARSIERRLHQGAPIQPTDAQAIVESAQRIHTATRDAVQRLLAVEIYNGSLRVALESLVERLRRAGAPDIELRLPAIVPDLHPQISEILYRTAQEALTNAVKHAQASRIAVELTLAGDQLGLRVTDNGVGFCVEAINGGFGLRTMRNRAEQAGGRFHSASRANVGTEILVELPLAPTLAR